MRIRNPGGRPVSRREWLRSSALAAVAVPGRIVPDAVGDLSASGVRARRALAVRSKAAAIAGARPAPRRACTRDEHDLGALACYSKGLPHNALGEVDEASYRLLRRAISTGNRRHFDMVPMGGAVKLANPQGALAFNLVGPDAARVDLPAPPAFASAEQAAEMVELYWQAILRDVPFDEYEASPLAERAAEDLSRLNGCRAPREADRITPRTLFRGSAGGDLAGGYISQLLWKDVPFAPARLEQRVRTPVPGVDHLTAYNAWLSCQSGGAPEAGRFDVRPRYVLTGRDLAEYVHRDFTFQGALYAALILLKGAMRPDGGNPYNSSRTQSAFTTFGSPFLFYLLATASQAALTACWYQKWQIHRRLRPEELAGRIENHRAGRARYPIHTDILDCAGMAEIVRRHGGALLPLSYPEGCPTHPSYPAGHAVLAGAGVTILKAIFDEDYVFPDPVVPSSDGLTLRHHEGPTLTVGGELDKLAANISMGRNFAGIHWRSDMTAGLALGEEVALAVLAEVRLTVNEDFSGWTVRRFDGTHVTV